MKNFIILFLTFYMLHSTLYIIPSIAQKQGQARIDSLLLELPKAKEDTNKVNLLDALSYGYNGINPDEGIKYGETGLKLAEKLNWKKGKAVVLNSLGVCYFTISNYSKALEDHIKSLKLYLEIGNKSSIALNLVNIGNIYYTQGDNTKALEYYFKGLRINEELRNKNGIAKTLGNIGLIYQAQSEYSKSLEYHFKALKINEELGDKNGIAINLSNSGTIYENQKDYSKALEYYYKALKLNEEIGNKNGIAINMWGIGLNYQEQGDYSKSLEYYFKALNLCEKIGDKSGIGSILGNIGVTYQAQGDYPKALEYYFKALKISETIGNKNEKARNLGNIGSLYGILATDTMNITERNEYVFLNKNINLEKALLYLLKAAEIDKEIGDLNTLIYTYKNLAEVYKEQKDFRQAYEYAEEAHKLQDSIFNTEKSKKIATLEAKRETDLKEKEIQLQKSELEKKNWQIFASLAAILLMIIFSFFVIRERRKSEKLLLNILPAKIASRLKKKEHPIADHFDEASVVFIDMVDFTKKSAGAAAKRVVEVLNILYSKLDIISKKHGLEKIKTIGDCYMAASGIPVNDPENTTKSAMFALEAMALLKNYDTGDGTILNFRCGIDCGPIVAGVIGEHKFIYDIWGDTVNTAARMEEYGEAGRIQVTERFMEKLKIDNVEKGISFEERGEIEIKGKGMMKTYFLEKG